MITNSSSPPDQQTGRLRPSHPAKRRLLMFRHLVEPRMLSYALPRIPAQAIVMRGINYRDPLLTESALHDLSLTREGAAPRG
jgi:hypothetical protein